MTQPIITIQLPGRILAQGGAVGPMDAHGNIAVRDGATVLGASRCRRSEKTRGSNGEKPEGGEMIYGSLCSGIEAATQAWHQLGWRPAFFSEIEKFPSAVLAHHYPGVPNLGDMTKFQEWPDHAIDLLVGGTPCQSFSVAGLRGGLADPRGNLMLTFGAVAQRYQPRWIVWENVPGVLSSNGGRDFGTFLGMLGELGYGVAYRILDAQFTRTCRHARAVPQRRRRVFVVGYLGDWRRATAVLFDGESLSGNPPPRRETGQNPAPTISARPTGGGGLGTDFDLDGGLIAAPSVSPALKARDAKGPSSDGDGDGAPLLAVAHALRGEGFDANEDGTGRGTPIVPIAIQERADSENPKAGPGGAVFRQDGSAYTLEARTVPQAVAFAENSRSEIRICGDDGQVAAQLTTGGGKPGQGYPAVAFDMRGREGGSQLEGPHDTANIPAADGGSSRSYVAETWAVRRLTPRECERLQGFPDDFTNIPWRGKPGAPDGPRYKSLGNSMAVNVMTWIGERIALVEGAIRSTPHPVSGSFREYGEAVADDAG